MLSKDYPTLAFHASITNPFGKGSLLGLLRQLARLRSDKKYISVGFVGYPNVGKSSVINTLRTKKVCNVGPVPGETKVWQYITLTKRVFLIDCPGVVYNRTQDTATDAVLKGVVRVENLDDATEHVGAVLERVSPAALARAYRLPASSWMKAPEEEGEGGEGAGAARAAKEDAGDSRPASAAMAERFLDALARRCGKLGRGGEADANTAAKMVLYDWQRGKIPFYAEPPKGGGESGGEAAAAAAAAAGEEDEGGRRGAAGDERKSKKKQKLSPSSSSLPLPLNAVSAEDAAGEAGASAEAAAAAATAVVETVAAAAGRQASEKMPLAAGLFDDEDEGSEEEESDDDDDDGDDDDDEERAASSSSDGDESDGYGDEGLSWEAVLASVQQEGAAGGRKGGKEKKKKSTKKMPTTATKRTLAAAAEKGGGSKRGRG